MIPSFEALMGCHINHHHQITTTPTTITRGTFIGNPNFAAMFDTWGNFDGNRPGLAIGGMELKAAIGAGKGFFEGDFDFLFDILSSGSGATTWVNSTKNRFENIAEIDTARATSPTRATIRRPRGTPSTWVRGLATTRTKSIILCPFGFVCQYRMRFVDFFETGFRLRVVGVYIRVILPR
jgi:hypothetical protein